MNGRFDSVSRSSRTGTGTNLLSVVGIRNTGEGVRPTSRVLVREGTGVTTVCEETIVGTPTIRTLRPGFRGHNDTSATMLFQHRDMGIDPLRSVVSTLLTKASQL